MDKNTTAYSNFTQKLLIWHEGDNDRQYPWKNEKDPYKVWLSEILLQQTRSDQGLSYYLKFTEQYPDIHSLANADDDDVFLLWQGLGYYNRCKNLLITARKISREFGGIFPDSYAGLLQLKGIGPYTAAAISSFAFGLPYAVLDGNVYRVLSRYFAISIPIDSSDGKKHFQDLVQGLLPHDKPAAFNQAIMDFGASVCKPKSPLCYACPLSDTCRALRQELVTVLPVKEKKIKIKKRQFHYFYIEVGAEVFIQQRVKNDIWQNLYELYSIETFQDYKTTEKWAGLHSFIIKKETDVFHYKQQLTHQAISSSFHCISLNSKPPQLNHGLWINKQNLKNYSFPKTILSFLDIKHYF